MKSVASSGRKTMKRSHEEADASSTTPKRRGRHLSMSSVSSFSEAKSPNTATAPATLDTNVWDRRPRSFALLPPRDKDHPSTIRLSIVPRCDGEGQRLIERLLSAVCRAKCARPFLDPVDPIELQIPLYLHVIKQPLSLRDIRLRMERHYYSSLQDLIVDIRHMLDNCWMFNAPRSPVYVQAQSLWSLVENEVNKMPVSERPSIMAQMYFRIPLQCLQVWMSKCERTLYRAANLPKSLCKRLARRGGLPPDCWPERWQFKARQKHPELQYHYVFTPAELTVDDS